MLSRVEKDRLNLYFPLCIDGGLGPELQKGAIALRDYLRPRCAFSEPAEDAICDPAIARGVVGYEAIRRRLADARSTLAGLGSERVFAAGGGCGIEVAIVGHLLRARPGLRVLWFDAHGDLNTPESSPSGHFHGMPLRFLLEPGLDQAISAGAPALDPAGLRLVGTRDLDPPEEAYIAARRIRTFGPARAAEAAAGWEGGPVYVHFDLDALDPREYPNVKCPVPAGISIAAAAEMIGGLARSRALVGMSIVENVATDGATLARLEPLFELALGL